jgi:alpha-1,2-mannosyltransferase
MACANRMPIMDCDEVYNYWEPLHYLLYTSGMQTWEYAPQYALRTYAYLVPMSLLSQVFEGLYTLLSPQARGYLLSFLVPLSLVGDIISAKLWTFFLLRASLAGITACLEMAFCLSLCHWWTSEAVALATGLLLVTSTGMAHAAGAFLPSTTIMAFWLLCACAYLRNYTRIFIGGAVVATLAIGWPFGVVVFVPMGLHLLITSQTPVKLLLGTALWTGLVQASVMVVDYYHYEHTWLSSTLNIVRYNAHEGGDELYGVEPALYYLKNLVLNFNYAAILGLLSLPIAAMQRVLGNPLPVPVVVVCIAPLYLWLAIVVPRPHKEERFLFPIYPALCACAAITLEQIWDLTVGRLYPKRRLFWILLLLPSCILCVSRTLALQKYYVAPLVVYGELAQHASSPTTTTTTTTTTTKLVCTCGEWHRFPSSFYLPLNYQLGFLPSSFRGQLPKPFGSPNGVFNDVNKEELDRYVENVDSCSYIIELEQGDNPECVRYMKDSGKAWTMIATHDYLDASQTSTLHRILYLPYLHEKAVEDGTARYNAYSLYQQNV